MSQSPTSSTTCCSLEAQAQLVGLRVLLKSLRKRSGAEHKKASSRDKKALQKEERLERA